MDYEFAVGDWVFCDRKLVQIQKVECSRVTSVSDGSFIHCGGN
jgi:microcystin-dependent protein